MQEFESQEGGCRGCFRNFWSFSTQKHAVNDSDGAHLLPERRPERERERESPSWVVKQVMKLREVSELVAGPKWKNFIRKIGSYFTYNNIHNKRKGFQYDSFDYKLNFDDGMHHHDHDYDHDGVKLGFSSSFAPPVVLDVKARSSTS